MKTFILSFIFSASLWAAPLLQDRESCLKNEKMEQLTELLLQKGSELKSEGDWDEHIHFAEKAIEYCKEQKKTIVLPHISNQVASTYFYRGDFSICRQKAMDAYEIFSSQNQKEGEIESLYLFVGSIPRLARIQRSHQLWEHSPADLV